MNNRYLFITILSCLTLGCALPSSQTGSSSSISSTTSEKDYHTWIIDASELSYDKDLILSDQSIYFDSDFAPITDIDAQQRLLLNPVKMTADLKLDVSDPEFTDLYFRVYIDQDNILYEINQNFSQITGITITPGIIAIYFYPEAEAITDQSITLKSIEHNGITYADGTYEIRYITQLK